MYELSTLGFRRLRRMDDKGQRAEACLLLRRPKHFALLTFLAIQNGELCRRDTLLALFWPESDERHARNALSKTLGRLRAELGDDVIRTLGAHDVGLHPGSVRADVSDFRRALSAKDWAGALEAYAGDFLDGFHVPNAATFAQWLDDQRSALRTQALTAAVRLTDQHEKRGDQHAAALSLRRALSIAPTDEALTRRLMSLLDQNGERAAALTTYHALADLLHTQLETAPADATRALATRIQASSTIQSLAVLPWANLTGAADQEHLSDGLTDLVITELARTRSARITSRQSSLWLKGSDISLSGVGRLLRVDAVVEGSVVRHGNHVAVTAQLIRVEPEEHLWAERFEAELVELPELACQIAHAVAERVRGDAPPTRESSMTTRPSAIDANAYEAYLRGRHFSVMLPQLGHAIACYQDSIARAPDFAPAWAGLASAYAILTLLAHVSPAEAFPAFRHAAERAVQLDPQLGEAHTSRGLYYMLAERDWQRADVSLARGAELAAGAVEPHTHRALFLAAMGRFAVAQAEVSRALEVDPLGAGAWFCGAWCNYKAGRYAESNRQLHELLELHPHFGLAFTYMGLNYAMLGQVEDAVAAARRGMQMLPHNHEALALGIATLGRAGHAGEGREALAGLLALGEVQYLDPWAVAVAYSGLGQIDDAVRWFRRMYDERSPSAFCIRQDPMLHLVSDVPGFREVRRKLAFPGAQPSS